jgi:trimeric autotransporter adhesin
VYGGSTGPVFSNSIARWTGSAWVGYGTGARGAVVFGLPAGPHTVTSIVVTPGNEILIAGQFSEVEGVPAKHLARWNGSGWSNLGGGCTDTNTGAMVRAMVQLPSGDVLAGGNFSAAGGVTVNNLGNWNGTVWSAVGGAGASASGLTDLAHALAVMPNGDVIVGGEFTNVGSPSAKGVLRWNGLDWSPLGTGISGIVYALAVMPNGDLVAGGLFTAAGGVSASRIARWNGTVWSPLGGGVTDPLPLARVRSLAVLPNGNLVAGGSFTSMGGVTVNHIAVWDGSTWSGLGTGMAGYSGMEPAVGALAVRANGDLVVAGTFYTAGGVVAQDIAVWGGAGWSALGTGGAGVPLFGSQLQAVTELANGDLVVGGSFHAIGGVAAEGIARWNGLNWAPISGGVLHGAVESLAALADGGFVAGGSFQFAGGVPMSCIARWGSSTAWTALGTGTNSHVAALAIQPNRDLCAAGSFTVAGGNGASYFARMATTCPATTTSLGSGCSGSAGPVVLSVASQPWIGGDFQATVTGIGPLAIAVALLGFGVPAIPLSLLHPAAGPDCYQLASADVAQLLLPVAGTATSRFAMPTGVAFVGVTLQTQVVQVEVDFSLNITGISSSNGLSLTIGVF